MENKGNCEQVIPSLLVRDMAETLAFYRKLGFEVAGCDGVEASSTWAEVRRGRVAFQLYSEPPMGTPAAPIFSGTLYITTNDLDSLVQEFQGRVEFVWGPEVMDYCMKEFAVQDPNGYFIAFSQPT